MTLTERRLNGSFVLDADGPIRGAAASDLVEGVRHALDAGHRDLVLNLSGVATIDAAGLGALAQSLTIARAAGGTLRLAGVAHRINDLLVLTRLLTAFETFDTVEQAAARAQVAYAGTRSVSEPVGDGLGAVPSF